MPIVRARLMGLLQAPAARITGAIAGSIRQVITVVKAYSEKEDAGAEAPAAPAEAVPA
jgi:hypothetical protein